MLLFHWLPMAGFDSFIPFYDFSECVQLDVDVKLFTDKIGKSGCCDRFYRVKLLSGGLDNCFHLFVCKDRWSPMIAFAKTKLVKTLPLLPNSLRIKLKESFDLLKADWAIESPLFSEEETTLGNSPVRAGQSSSLE
jgi:hypothetical protein